MRKAIIAMATSLMMLMGAGITFAQDKGAVEKKGAVAQDAVKDKEKKEEKKEEKKDDKALEAIKDIYRRLDIGVKIFMDWTMKWGQKDSGPGSPYATGDGAGSGAFDRVVRGGNGGAAATPLTGTDYSPKNNNGFNISRAYLDVKYKINDIFLVRVTSDIDAAVSPSTSAKDANPAFHLYLKYAYLEAKKDFGPVTLSLQGGQLETPIIGFIDNISDYRWIAQNYIDQAKIMLNGNSLDNSADLGLKGSIGIMKYVTMTGSFTNGSGYKADEANSYKAGTYLLNVTPIRELNIFGFGRNEITTKYDFTGRKAKREYYGYGIAYSSDIIKVGFAQVFPYLTTVGLDYGTGGLVGGAVAGNNINCSPVTRRAYMLIDSWLNFYLGSLVEQAPLELTGRFVYGKQDRTYQRKITDPECGKSRNTYLYAIGLGWVFNKNFRILIGGEIEHYQVVKNRALEYAETTTASPNYYNAAGLGAGQIFVGSRNPHDTRRLYVKAEAKF